jgi:FixJ family two-component response regulator
MGKKHNTVYIIDDDESVRKAFGRLLRSADFDVETFSSPDEFLQATMEREHACTIADIRMSGSTGFALMEKLAAQGMRLPVIVISASDDEHIREHVRELGAVSFFRKPVDDQALLDAIWWAISRTEEDK